MIYTFGGTWRHTPLFSVETKLKCHLFLLLPPTPSLPPLYSFSTVQVLPYGNLRLYFVGLRLSPFDQYSLRLVLVSILVFVPELLN